MKSPNSQESNSKNQLRSTLLQAADHLRAQGNFKFLNNEPGIFTTFELVALIEELAGRIDCEDESVGKRLWGIFAPTCAWDDAGGDSQLGEDTYQMINAFLSPQKK